MMKEKTYVTDKGTIHYWVSVAEKPANNQIEQTEELPDSECNQINKKVENTWFVFLPGLTADHSLFQGQCEYFTGKVNYIVWDGPAHGLSRPFSLDFTMEDIARYLHGIFEKEGVTRPLLVGQSFGGYLSQCYMNLYPKTVVGFVCIDSTSINDCYLSGVEVWWLKHTKWMYLSIPWKLLIAWGAKGTAYTEQGRQNMRAMMESYKKREYCALATYGYRLLGDACENKHLYTIDCPIVQMCGEHDEAASTKRLNKEWSKVDKHLTLWVPKAGHNANRDNPEFVNKALEEFLAIL